MTIGMPDVTKRWQIPPLASDNRWLGGVAAAIAGEVGVQPIIIRSAFVFLTIAGGGGILLYAISWAMLAYYQPSRLGPYVPIPKAASPARRTLAVALVTLGLAPIVPTLGFGIGAEFLIPVGLILTGALVAWSQQNDGGVPAVIRIVIGVALATIGIGAALFLSVSVIEAVRLLLVAVAVVGGIALVITPSVIRIGQDFDDERQKRVRADERSRMAAHLHDSVLQTLSLIQRHADDPRRTAQIARQQERELRQWLYGKEPTQAGATRLTAALQAAAARVEERHDVRVEVVVVGDNTDLDPGSIEGLVAATHEAMTNAANHAKVPDVDVYAERRADAIEVYVRDAGVGFDPTDIGDDRQGIRSSIIERMGRVGGSATIHSDPGQGTEVELRLPFTSADPDAPAEAAKGETP